MAREVLIRTWCDLCLGGPEEARVPAEEIGAVKLPEVPGGPRFLALCVVHHAEVYEPLVRALTEFGQESELDVPKRKRSSRAITAEASGNSQRLQGAASPTAVKCPVGDCEEWAASEEALTSHARRRHDMTLAQLRGQPTPYRCEVEGCAFASSRPQGLGAHQRAAHGIEGTSETSLRQRELVN